VQGWGLTMSCSRGVCAEHLYNMAMTVDEARSQAMDVLRQCRNGERPSCRVTPIVPTLREACEAYCKAKSIKPSSQRRYESIFRTHFGTWLDRPVSDFGYAEFAEHCHPFAQSKGAALVEVGLKLSFPPVSRTHSMTTLPKED